MKYIDEKDVKNMNFGQDVSEPLVLCLSDSEVEGW